VFDVISCSFLWDTICPKMISSSGRIKSSLFVESTSSLLRDCRNCGDEGLQCGENGVVHPRLLNYPTNNLNLRYLLVFISFFRNTKKNCVLVQHDTKVTSATNEMAIRTRC
jgi:hypothetical protein